MTIKGTGSKPSQVPAKPPEVSSQNLRKEALKADNKARPAAIEITGRGGEGMTITTRAGGRTETKHYNENELPRFANYSKAPEAETKENELYAKRRPSRSQASQAQQEAVKAAPARAKQPQYSYLGSRLKDALMSNEDFVKDMGLGLKENGALQVKTGVLQGRSRTTSPWTLNEIDFNRIFNVTDMKTNKKFKPEDFDDIDVKSTRDGKYDLTFKNANAGKQVTFTFDPADRTVDFGFFEET